MKFKMENEVYVRWIYLLVDEIPLITNLVTSNVVLCLFRSNNLICVREQLVVEWFVREGDEE